MGLQTIELFAGAGGGVYASKLLGHSVVCYVEADALCQDILRARIADGTFDDAPIWSDVCTFDGQAWRGKYDLLCGGFPCQPFSSAARGNHVATDLWPEMLRITQESRPRRVFAENVAKAAIEPAAADLYAEGYDVAYGRLSCADLGAVHRRTRWWLFAYAHEDGQPRRPVSTEVVVDRRLSGLAWAEDPTGHLGMDAGMAGRLKRLGTLGNGQSPVVAAAAYRTLESVLIAQRDR